MGRAPCCSKGGLHRRLWTPREDSLLASYIQTHGVGQWRELPKNAGLLRSGKSCRLRWMNYLRPDIKRGDISPDEDDLIIRLHALLGNRWSLIAGRFPGRTDNEIKNYWNTHLSKKLCSQGTNLSTQKKISDHVAPPTDPKPMKKRTPPTNNKKQKGYIPSVLVKPKVHRPKSIRVTSLSHTKNINNASFESNLSSISTPTNDGSVSGTMSTIAPSYWQTYDLTTSVVQFMIDDEEDDVASLVEHEHGVMEHQHLLYQNDMFDKLYNEYLQLLKVDNDDEYLSSLCSFDYFSLSNYK